jgi:hypothetical protein
MDPKTKTHHLKLPTLSLFVSFRFFRGKKTKRTQNSFPNRKSNLENLSPRDRKLQNEPKVGGASCFAVIHPGPKGRPHSGYWLLQKTKRTQNTTSLALEKLKKNFPGMADKIGGASFEKFVFNKKNMVS